MAVSAPPATFAAICATGAAWLQQDDRTYALDAQGPEPPPVATLAWRMMRHGGEICLLRDLYRARG